MRPGAALRMSYKDETEMQMMFFTATDTCRWSGTENKPHPRTRALNRLRAATATSQQASVSSE